jgi:hypothetical protein
MEERLRRVVAVISFTSILVAALIVLGLSALFALALGRAASRGDTQFDVRRLRAQAAGELSIAGTHQSYADQSYAGLVYAGLARAQSTIVDEPSSTVPSSRRSVGTQRLPVNSFTSRRPRVRLHTPGSAAKP